MKITESQNTHTNVEKTDNNHSSKKQLVEYKPIGKTPFTAVRNDKDWFITVGKYKIPRIFQDQLECIDYVENNLWEMIGMFVAVVIEENNKINKEQK